MGEVIEFRLNERSGVPTYLQLVHQVRQAVRLGVLQPGDQLPTVKEVVGKLAINPNTVLKAYRELDHEGLVEGRRGQGTFVSRMLEPTPPREYMSLQAALLRWIAQAREAGLDEDDIAALVAATVPAAFVGEEAA
jgi:GntR family transcriptional regulator